MGHVYVLFGTDPKVGFQLYRWVGRKIWYPVPGKKALRIGIGKNGRPHIIDPKGKVFAATCTGEEETEELSVKVVKEIEALASTKVTPKKDKLLSEVEMALEKGELGEQFENKRVQYNCTAAVHVQLYRGILIKSYSTIK